MLTQAPALLPDWLNAETLLTNLGPYAFWGAVLIIFAECGLLIGFFLPGDSLIFVVGLLIAQGSITMNIWVATLIMIVAAVAGNLVGYWIGAKAGPPLFDKPDSRFFRKEYVDKTHAFFEQYGPRAIILARFVPIVRTFITAIAGVGQMDYRKYVTYSTIGGVIWAGGVMLAGYFLGGFPIVQNNLEIILLSVVFLSAIPIAIEIVRSRRSAPPVEG
ncbi:MAG: VTT domain-containing protein [Candidatus Nanopelagicales bacterium]